MNKVEIVEQQYVVNEIDKCVEKSKVKVYDFVKRIIDIIIGIIGCVFLIPITIIVKVLYIINKENGSIFYKQDRIGKNGKIFKLYKFRSMVENADDVLQKILNENEKLKEEYETNKKMVEDPRITKTGKILRKTSIDETPQFLNILKGDMSFIGNRPYLVREKEDMGRYFDDIVKIKPGLTGLWQTSGRSAITFKERLIIEKKYSQEYSFRLDLKILKNSIKDVITRKGAI